MSDDQQARWDARHADARDLGSPPAILTRYQAMLPRSGRALDMACGRGAASLWLAQRGLTVDAWDFSPVAIARLRGAAAQGAGRIDAQVRDVLAEPPAPASFDLILVSHFLERDLCPAIAAALRPGGLLCYQTFGPAVPGTGGPSNPDFRLAANELLRLFPALTVRAYHEPGEHAAEDDPLRGLALLVAERPSA